MRKIYMCKVYILCMALPGQTIRSRRRPNLFRHIMNSDASSFLGGIGNVLSKKTSHPAPPHDAVVRTLQQRHPNYNVVITAMRPTKDVMTKNMYTICYGLTRDGAYPEDMVRFAWYLETNQEELRAEIYKTWLIHNQGIATGDVSIQERAVTEKGLQDFALLYQSPQTALSYYEWLANNQLSNERLHKFAETIARFLARLHISLTQLSPTFEKYALDVLESDPFVRLKSEFFAGLEITSLQERTPERRIVEILYEAYNKLQLPLVISHGDAHGDNFRAKSNVSRMNLTNFALIDWATLQWANPYMDLSNFWVHHERKALELCQERQETPFGADSQMYQGDFGTLEREYFSELRKWGQLKNFNVQDIRPHTASKEYYALQTHIEEIFAPKRKPGHDTDAKAVYHFIRTRNMLSALAQGSWGDSAEELDYNITKLCARKPCLEQLCRKSFEEF